MICCDIMFKSAAFDCIVIMCVSGCVQNILHII